MRMGCGRARCLPFPGVMLPGVMLPKGCRGKQRHVKHMHMPQTLACAANPGDYLMATAVDALVVRRHAEEVEDLLQQPYQDDGADDDGVAPVELVCLLQKDTSRYVL